MCSAVLVGGLLGVLELEAVVEAVQSWAADQCRWDCRVYVCVCVCVWVVLLALLPRPPKSKSQWVFAYTPLGRVHTSSISDIHLQFFGCLVSDG